MTVYCHQIHCCHQIHYCHPDFLVILNEVKDLQPNTKTVIQNLFLVILNEVKDLQTNT